MLNAIQPVRISQARLTAAQNRAKIFMARLSFWEYCKLMFPQHYSDDRPHLRQMCDELQSFVESDDNVMIINAPPRHYKSFTATSLTEWLIGHMPDKKFMTGSYNSTLSETFSKQVRNTIDTKKFDPNIVIFSDIFPDIKIKSGDGAMERWSLEGQHSTYLSTSPTGTATGFGCDFLIIDDLIKSAYEANNSMLIEAQWKWFTETMISRIEEGGKIIIVMTRWISKDLAGRVLEHFLQRGKKVRQILFKAHLGDGVMLCPSILSYETFLDKIAIIGPEIVSANYQQEPIDILGKLYSSLKTYDEIPKNDKDEPLFSSICAYVDTADEGSDYLCCIIYGEYQHEAYVLDIYYTREPMEITEEETARRLTAFDVSLCYIESNNGGRGFARAVERHLRSSDIKNFRTIVRPFTQGKNKKARILTSATWVMQHIYFPKNWKDRSPDFFESMNTYQREGANAHDDAEDTITGVMECCTKQKDGVLKVRV